MKSKEIPGEFITTPSCLFYTLGKNKHSVCYLWALTLLPSRRNSSIPASNPFLQLVTSLTSSCMILEVTDETIECMLPLFNPHLSFIGSCEGFGRLECTPENRSWNYETRANVWKQLCIQKVSKYINKRNTLDSGLSCGLDTKVCHIPLLWYLPLANYRILFPTKTPTKKSPALNNLIIISSHIISLALTHRETK